MAELILPENRHLYEHLLDEMHERRYQLFFDGLGWCPDECGIEHPGYDKDRFDKLDTVYIIQRMPGSGEVVGFCRINPTTSPHMMDEIFAGYCEYTGVPVGPDIHEVSRLGYDYRVTGDRETWKLVRAQITSSISEYCLSLGIKQVTYCVHDFIFNAIQSDTWGAKPLGRPVHDEKLGKTYQAGISDITQEGLLRCKARLPHPEDDALTYSGPAFAWRRKEAA